MTRGLVIGLGNRDRGDDAVGLLLARRLREVLPKEVPVREHEGDLLALLALWRDADLVIVVDAMRSGAPPGSVRRFEAHREPLPAAMTLGYSTHGVGLAEVIELARSLKELPSRLIVYGVEGARFEPGGSLTPEVARAIEPVVQSVLRDLRA